MVLLMTNGDFDIQIHFRTGARHLLLNISGCPGTRGTRTGAAPVFSRFTQLKESLDQSQNLYRTCPHDLNKSQNMVKTSPRVFISSGCPGRKNPPHGDWLLDHYECVALLEICFIFD